MKGFAINDHGDIVIERNDVKLAYDTELLIQKIRQVLSTNRGEWRLDPKEGIPVQKVLRKNPNVAMIRDYVRSAISQVDKSLQMTRCDITTENRKLKINFEIADQSGTVMMETEV